jgi:hypothetical protein
MPSQPEDIATVRMVEMVAVQELQPATIPLTRSLVGLETDDRQLNTLLGGADNDFLSGGEGSDTIRGGTGIDLFAFFVTSDFQKSGEVNIIKDYEVNKELIALYSFGGVSSLEDLLSLGVIFQLNANVVISTDPSAGFGDAVGSIVIENVNLKEFSNSNFIFGNGS